MSQYTPSGWVALRLEFEPGYPEDVAFGPPVLMNRLKLWLERYFAHVASEGAAAASDVLAERRRQIEVEGWTPGSDDGYDEHELARAAACYAEHSHRQFTGAPPGWPWHHSWWKPKDARHSLVRAGALILAEIERLDRAAIRRSAPPSPVAVGVPQDQGVNTGVGQSIGLALPHVVADVHAQQGAVVLHDLDYAFPQPAPRTTAGAGAIAEHPATKDLGEHAQIVARLQHIEDAALLALGILWMTESGQEKVQAAYTALRNALGGKEALGRGISAAIDAGYEADHPAGADWWCGKKER